MVATRRRAGSNRTRFVDFFTAMIDISIPLIAILGPTASGKSELALELAEAVGGEIVCADSRTIYRGMDIGTAKPGRDDQQRVRHHLLDVIAPDERLSAAAFKTLAETAIDDVWRRGRVPFLVGGSGLYIDAVLFDYQFPAEADVVRRRYLEGLSDQELLERLAAEDSAALDRIDIRNRRRVMRALETIGQSGLRQKEVRPRTLVLGLALNKEVIRSKIENRVKEMLSQGLMEEVSRIGQTYGWESEALRMTGYRQLAGVILETKTMEQGAVDVAQAHVALVKKQLTWFKRNPEIVWLGDRSEALGLVRQFLDLEQV